MIKKENIPIKIMRAIIFANGKFEKMPDNLSISPDDFIIAADGGALHCKKMGITPSIIVGDCDSLCDADLKQFQSQGIDIKKYPRRKDKTDLELALNTAFDSGIKEIIILAALGARWDMTIANILLMANIKNARIIDGSQELMIIHEKQNFQLYAKKGDSLSLIPLNGDVFGVTLKGLEYPLNNENLKFGSSRGISNVIIDSKASVYIQKGVLLCILIHNKN